MKLHFNVIFPDLYQRDIVSEIKMDVHIVGVYWNGVLKKILDLRAMEYYRIHAAICLKHLNKRDDLGDLGLHGE